MKTIYKYEIPLADGEIPIALPERCHFLDAHYQDDKIYMWCMVDTETELVNRYFIIYGTGHEIDDTNLLRKLNYLKTIHVPDGFVWHLFEILSTQASYV